MIFDDKIYQELMYACFEDSKIDIVKKILKENNNKYINGIEEDNFTPLLRSLLSKSKNIAKLLLENGADPNKFLKKIYQNSSYSMPTLSRLIDAQKESAYQAIDYALEDGIYLEEEDSKYNNIIENSIKDVEMIEFLINHGADINLGDDEGYTPLDNSVIFAHPYARDLLIKLGAKHSQKYINKGKTNYSNYNDFVQTSFVNNTLPSTHKSIEQSKSWGKKSYDGELKYDIVFVKSKVERNFDINEIDWKDRTALDFGIEIGNKEAEEFLRQHGAVSFSELPPIHKEIRLSIRDKVDGRTKVKELRNLPELIKSNDINYIDTQNLTPLDLAIKLKNKQAEEYLREHGGKTSKELEDENKS